jgi:HlyD family secretion protein
MRGFVRVLIIVGVLAVLAFVGMQFFQGVPQAGAQEQSAEIQDETTVEAGTLTVTVSGTGTVQPIRQSSLAFELSQPVAEVLVQEGQSVEAGQVLATLNVTDLESALEDAEVEYRRQQVEFDALIAPVREEDIAVARAELTSAQAAAGAASDGPSAEEVEIARLETEIARNELWQQQLDNADILASEFRGDNAEVQDVQAESAVTQAGYGVDIADANYAATLSEGPDLSALSSANAQAVAAEIRLNDLLDGPDAAAAEVAAINLESARIAVEQARANLAKAVLVAPFNGIVAENNLTVGELPPEGTSFELIDTDSYYIDVAVDETDIAAVRVGQRVDLRLDALPEAEITGTVTRVDVTPTFDGDVVTYTVRVTLDPALVGVRVGMSSTATVIVEELQETLILRNRFIRIDRLTEDAFVTVQKPDGQFEEIPVVLGLRNDTESQIISGLEAGQRVVLLPRESFDVFGGG